MDRAHPAVDPTMRQVAVFPMVKLSTTAGASMRIRRSRVGRRCSPGKSTPFLPLIRAQRACRVRDIRIAPVQLASRERSRSRRSLCRGRFLTPLSTIEKVAPPAMSKRRASCHRAIRCTCCRKASEQVQVNQSIGIGKSLPGHPEAARDVHREFADVGRYLSMTALCPLWIYGTTSAVTLAPILFTDPVTGRTFVSQLLGDREPEHL